MQTPLVATVTKNQSLLHVISIRAFRPEKSFTETPAALFRNVPDAKRGKNVFFAVAGSSRFGQHREYISGFYRANFLGIRRVHR